MQHKTAILTGPLLNAGVAKAQRHRWEICGDTVFADWCTEEKAMAPYHPSTGAVLGQAILKAEGIPFTGDLEADMRAYLFSVFGESVDLEVEPIHLYSSASANPTATGSGAGST